jgi:hypothetical protein
MAESPGPAAEQIAATQRIPVPTYFSFMLRLWRNIPDDATARVRRRGKSGVDPKAAII